MGDFPTTRETGTRQLTIDGSGKDFTYLHMAKIGEIS